MTECAPGAALPRFVVCEDGDEYVRRFVRFLGARFEFVATQSYRELREELGSSAPNVGVLLDLDFRRTPPSELIDERGELLGPAAGRGRHQLSEQQGICILTALRRANHPAPAILFADFESAGQTDYLVKRLAPLEIVPSSVGLGELSEKLAKLAGGE